MSCLAEAKALAGLAPSGSSGRGPLLATQLLQLHPLLGSSPLLASGSDLLPTSDRDPCDCIGPLDDPSKLPIRAPAQSHLCSLCHARKPNHSRLRCGWLVLPCPTAPATMLVRSGEAIEGWGTGASQLRAKALTSPPSSGSGTPRELVHTVVKHWSVYTGCGCH